MLGKGRLKEFPLSLINGDPETEEYRVTNGHHSVDTVAGDTLGPAWKVEVAKSVRTEGEMDFIP